MKYRFVAAVALAAGIFVVAASACNGTPQAPTCVDIPDGGCPEDYEADYCEDPTCDTLYACTASGWVQIGTCPPHPMPEAGSMPDVMEAGCASDANALADAPPGAVGGGCQPALDDTDCQLGTALLCNPACNPLDDCCGCQDLWVCVDSTWVLWGECTEAGIVPNGQ